MGLLFSSFFNRLFGSKEIKIVILGLDNAGKTTILYKLASPDEVMHTMPTIGFNVEYVVFKNVKLHVWDLGGQTNLRPYWSLYFSKKVDAVVYVVDSADQERLSDAKLALLTVLEEEALRSTTLLVFANKQDMSGALTSAQISEGLGLTNLRGRQWHICKTSALRGDGINEGFDWLVDSIQQSNS